MPILSAAASASKRIFASGDCRSSKKRWSPWMVSSTVASPSFGTVTPAPRSGLSQCSYRVSVGKPQAKRFVTLPFVAVPST